MDLLDTLNEQQREAATSIAKSTLILSGAGCGKTHTLTTRVAWLIGEQHVIPQQLLLVTFTNKAAEEMVTRLKKLVGKDADEITACTFHSFCAKELRVAGAKGLVPIDPEFSILSSADSLSTLKLVRDRASKEIIDENGKKKTINPFKIKDAPNNAKLLKLYSELVNVGKEPGETRLQFFERKLSETTAVDYVKAYAEIADQLLSAYRAYKHEHNLMDYDDLLTHMGNFLYKYQPFRESVQQHYKYILVDEYQDTNNIQEFLLKRMVTPETSLTVVGDDYQSIYKFRGANVENFITFPDRYEDCKKVFLTRNYRSNQETLDLMNAMMDRQADFGFPKEMTTDKRGPRPVLLTPTHSNRGRGNQAEDIAYKIKYLLENGVRYEDIVILVRNTASNPPIELALKQYGIESTIRGGVKFFERQDVQLFLSFQKVIANPFDEVQWASVLTLLPEIGEARSARIVAKCREDRDFLIHTEFEKRKTKTDNTVCDALHEIYDEMLVLQAEDNFHKQNMKIADYIVSRQSKTTDINHKNGSMTEETYEDKIAAIKNAKDAIYPTLISMAEKYEGLLPWLEALVLNPEKNSDSEEGKIVISTIHSAKGLEWDYVFAPDLVDDIFPRYQTNEDRQEDLRTMYVMGTRAREQLIMYSPSFALMFGQPVKTGRCEFLQGLNKDMDRESTLGGWMPKVFIHKKEQKKEEVEEEILFE